VEALLKKGIDSLNLDRSNWQLVKFGDVAIQQKQSVDRENTDITRYVKGEHMYSEDIHLREWGELKDEYLGPAFIRYFEKGDILYGSRRTYLRKVTVAPFEGITSNTTFVIKANENMINKYLLPFLMLSDEFTEHSIQNSKGSVNPYINWKDIANYEFLLPSKEQHAEIAELLWSTDKVIQEDLKVLKTLENLLYAKTKSFFQDSQNKIKIKEIVIDKACKKAEVGLSPYIEIGDIDTFNKKIIFKDKESVKGSIIASQDSVLVSKVRPYRGAVHILKEDQIVTNGFSILNVNEAKSSPSFLFYCIAWNKDFYYQMSRLSAGSTYPTVEDEDILGYSIPYVDENLQKEYVEKIDQIYTAFSNIESKINKTKNLLNVLINQIF
tara:strand:- start:533 stop:1678 length:1146 start_codon:yes stop_codon:yes gene_type:complete